jgi:hypothetical protein
MKELTDKIAAIIRKHEYWTMGADEAAKEIAALFKSQLRSELIAYDKWLSDHYFENYMPTPERAVDEYLNQKK